MDAWNRQNHSKHGFTNYRQDCCSCFGQKIEPTTDKPVLLHLSSPTAVDIYYTVFTNTLSNSPSFAHCLFEYLSNFPDSLYLRIHP